MSRCLVYSLVIWIAACAYVASLDSGVIARLADAMHANVTLLKRSPDAIRFARAHRFEVTL